MTGLELMWVDGLRSPHGVCPQRSVAAEEPLGFEELADLLSADEDASHHLIGGIGLEELKDAVEVAVVVVTHIPFQQLADG